MSQADSSRSEALAYLETFVDVERGDRPIGGLSLDRTREILAALGNPQNRYPSVIIAGTNGKGSTAAMVERGLRAAGLRTGLYTQPHLHTIRERVRLDGTPIDQEAFEASMRDVRYALDHVCDASHPTTAYEVMTSLALQRFAESKIDVAVLEVGLGGRLDSTNVVEAAVSAITPISLDHTQILGDTIAAIAGEKADVIKRGRVVVSAPQHPDALAVIRAVASSRGATLRIADDNHPLRIGSAGEGTPYGASLTESDGEGGARWDDPPREWDLLTKSGRLADVHPGLRGAHQRTNSAVAASIFDALREAGIGPIPLDAVRTGIELAEWPGRFEIVPGEPPIVIDGAHNVAAARALTDALDTEFPGRRRVFVLGIATDKDVPSVIGALVGPIARSRMAAPPAVIATRANHPRAAAPDTIAGVVTDLGTSSMTAPTVAVAIDQAVREAQPDDVIVVAGSLYVVAEARGALGLAAESDHIHFDPWATR